MTGAILTKFGRVPTAKTTVVTVLPGSQCDVGLGL
jgi:hypothetical protein